jgi:protochlorophyllide reductase
MDVIDASVEVYLNVFLYLPNSGTGLFRDQNQVFTKVFDVAATSLFKVGETTHWGGGALEYMALSSEVANERGGLFYTAPPGSSKYGDDAFGREFKATQASKEARASDVDGKAKRFWELSEKLVGV